MKGMHCDTSWAYTTGSDTYTASWHYELPPTPTIAELSLVSYYEFDDKAHADLAFTHMEFMGPEGETRHRDYPSIDALDAKFAVVNNTMIRIDWAMGVSNAYASWLLNLFYWNSVS